MEFGVGLWCLQSTANNPRSHVTAYRELRDDARMVEELGFRDLWLSEHHFFYDGYCPALLPAAAGALAVTERLRVATGMLLLPLQDTRRLATMAATLGQRSGGRLELGLGLGYRDVEFAGKGVPRSERVARLATGLEDLAATAPDVPVWIGSASPAGVARAGARGLGVLLSGGNPLSLVTELAAAHRDGWEQAGGSGRRPTVAALRNVWVVDSDAERAAVLDWVRASYVLYAGLGWSVAATGGTAAMDFRRDAERAVADAVATTIIGSAEQVADELSAVAAAGVDHVVLRTEVEGAPREVVALMLRRFADRVLPKVAS